MQAFRHFILIISLISCLSGCSSVREREDFFSKLSPERINGADWHRLVGVYKGYTSSCSRAFGNNGVTEDEIILEISGGAENPLVYMIKQSSASSAWNASVSYTEKFTNIPQRVYGGAKQVLVSSHAPNELLISLKPELFSPNRGTAMILTFREDGSVDVEYIGHYGRRGIGRLLPVPSFGNPGQ